MNPSFRRRRVRRRVSVGAWPPRALDGAPGVGRRIRRGARFFPARRHVSDDVTRLAADRLQNRRPRSDLFSDLLGAIFGKELVQRLLRNP